MYNGNTVAGFDSILIIHIASGMKRFKTFETGKNLSRVTWRFVLIVNAEKIVLNILIMHSVTIFSSDKILSQKYKKKTLFKCF